VEIEGVRIFVPKEFCNRVKDFPFGKGVRSVNRRIPQFALKAAKYKREGGNQVFSLFNQTVSPSAQAQSLLSAPLEVEEPLLVTEITLPSQGIPLVLRSNMPRWAVDWSLKRSGHLLGRSLWYRTCEGPYWGVAAKV
jgi:hypothetical protein